MPITASKDSAEKEQNPAPQNIQYGVPYPQQIEDVTIDLYELWITLWNKKWLFIAVTVIAALGSVVYALLAPQIYKAEALLLPPNAKDVKSFSVLGFLGEQQEKGIQSVKKVLGVSASQAFDAFKNNLSSRSLQKKFIDEYGLMDILAPNRTPETRDVEILEGFAKMIKIEGGKGLSVSMEDEDPEFAAKLINDYVRFFDFETVRALVSDARNAIEEQIMDIENIIASKREMGKLRREDQINEIEFSIASKRQIAKKRREDQINEIEYSIASTRELAKIRREDKIMEIESSISSKRELAKQRRLDQITGIENTIAAKREGAKQRRLDQILRFREAIVIADSLGIRKREDATSFIKSSQMNLDIITSTNPLYYAGTQSLEAEISILEQRVSDDPFIPELRDLQEQLAQLHAIKSDDPTIAGLRDLQEELGPGTLDKIRRSYHSWVT